MRERIMNFVYRWRTDNNVRCLTLWVLVGLWFVFNLTVYGFGPAIEFGRSEETQRYYNAYTIGAFASDAELASWGSAVVRGAIWFWGWARWSSWVGWALALVGGVVYTPVVFRDEFERAKESVARLREERGGQPREQQVPQQAAAATAAGRLTFAQFLKWDLIVELVTEIVRSLIRREWR